MREKFALLYYAAANNENSHELMCTYAAIPKRQRLRLTGTVCRGIQTPAKTGKEQVYFHRNVAKWLEQLNKPQQRKLYKAVKKEFGRK